MDVDSTTQTREHLETAYIRDLSVGLTLFDEPKLLGRRPVTYKSMFSYLYEQQVYREVQGILPLEYRNLNDSNQSQLHGKLQSWVQMAAGRDRHPNVDTRVKSKEDGSDQGASQAKGSLQDDEIVEAQERLFQYFFSSSSRQTSDSGCSPSSRGGKELSPRKERHSNRIGGLHSASPAHSESTIASQMPSVFFGMRQIPAHSPDYLSALYDWSVYFTVAHDRSLQIPLPNTTVNTPQVLTVEDMPEIIKNILRMAKPMLLFPPKCNAKEDPEPEEGVHEKANVSCGVSMTSTRAATDVGALSGEQKSSTGGAGGSRSTVGGGALSGDCVVGATCTLEEYVYNPVVMNKVEGVMNSLVPPRLLIFFDIDPKQVEKQYRNRERRQRKIEALIQENATHPGNRRLLRELQEERELQCTEDPMVGEAMMLIEPPSMSQSTRADLLALEKEVDMHLRKSGSRCWGLPLRMSSHGPSMEGEYVRNDPASIRGGTGKVFKKRKGRETATEIIRQGSPYLSAGRGGGANGSGVAPPSATTTISGTASTTPPTGAVASSSSPPMFYNTICHGSLPSTLTKDAGGTATVTTTLNLVELNRERTGIYLHLLGEEVLRQVVLDLPERGVLLSRLFNEALLSLRTFEVLLEESVSHSAKILMVGQKERELAHKNITELKSEVESLRKKKEALTVRKASLQTVFGNRKALEIVRAQQERKLQETLLERLRLHADFVKETQDRERRGSLTED